MAKDSLKKLSAQDLKKANDTLTAILTHETYADAARALNITEQGLIKRRNKYKLDEIIAKHVDQARQKLQQGSIRAANKLVDMIDDKRYAMEASKEVLDRVGLSSKQGPVIAQQFNTNEMTLEFTTDE